MTNKTVLSDAQRKKICDEKLVIYHYSIRHSIEIIKAVEEAVLQSPEIQRLRAKAARYDWLRSLDQIREHDDWQIYDGYGNTPRGSDLDDAIDAAMETKQP